MYIIDCHSHFGTDYYKGKINLNDYVEYANKLNVNLSMLMPPGSPMNKEENDKLLKIKYINGKYYYSIKKNPFIKMNYNYYEELLKNPNVDKKRFIFVPYIHPILDETSKIEQMIYEMDTPFLKINGVQSGFDLNDISKKFVDMIKIHKVFLIIHTQYQKKYSDNFLGNRIIKRQNHPYEWAQFLVNNDLSGILNHGCGLDMNTFKLIEDKKNILVALGPDLALMANSNRINIPLDNDNKLTYLFMLRKMLDSKKICFDLDYNYCLVDGEKKFEDVYRIEQVFSDKECEQIFCENILNANKKLQKKI